MTVSSPSASRYSDPLRTQPIECPSHFITVNLWLSRGFPSSFQRRWIYCWNYVTYTVNDIQCHHVGSTAASDSVVTGSDRGSLTAYTDTGFCDFPQRTPTNTKSIPYHVTISIQYGVTISVSYNYQPNISRHYQRIMSLSAHHITSLSALHITSRSAYITSLSAYHHVTISVSCYNPPIVSRHYQRYISRHY